MSILSLDFFFQYTSILKANLSGRMRMTDFMIVVDVLKKFV